MEELLKNIVTGLVDDPDSIKITTSEGDDGVTTVYHIDVADADKGRVIGKQGRIAKAIRTIMFAAAARHEAKIAVQID